MHPECAKGERAMLKTLRLKTLTTGGFLVLFAAILGVAVLPSAAMPRGPSDQRLRNLSGHVLDRQDNPLSRAIVYLKNTKTLAVKTYISDADGTYRFPALSPNIDYEIYA